MKAEYWTRRLPPLPGELLSSCLSRNAFAHGLSPYRFLNLVWEGDPVWSRDFDRDPDALLRIDRSPGAASWPEEIAGALGISRATVINATLTNWRAILGSCTVAGAADSRLILSAGIQHRTRTRHALQYCPDCLAEKPSYFRREWRLGVVLWCPIHDRVLQDACPHCDAAIIPHRSMSIRQIDCHQCGRDITKRGRAIREIFVSDSVRRLQCRFTDLCFWTDSGSAMFEQPDLDAADLSLTVRALIAASTSRSAGIRLREAFGLSIPSELDDPDRRRFENARLYVRAPWMETVAAWMSNWPHNFFTGAEAMGASRLTFARGPMCSSLKREVERLPARHRAPRKPWASLLDEPVINRLRRTDRAAYHALRAARILDAIGVRSDV